MTVTIGRRELLAALGGTAAGWPLAARAQQSAISVIGFSGFSGADVHDFRHSTAVHIQDFSGGRSLA